METELFLTVSFMYCTLAMEQKIVLFSTYLHIFTYVVLIELCLRNNVYLIKFLLYKSNIWIISISCDHDGFKFFWSCPTFWKNVSFFWSYFSRLSSALLLVLLLCLMEVQSFQCFYFYLVCCYYFESYFCFCFVKGSLYLASVFCCWIASFICLDLWIFSNP